MSKVGFDNTFRTRNEVAPKKVAYSAEWIYHVVKEYILARGWSPLVLLARTTLVSLMEKITRGQLRVLTQDGIYTFGDAKLTGADAVPGGDELRAELRVVNDAFWVRMLILCDLGFAEAYMAGDVLVDSLDNVFKIFILNRSNLSELSTTTSHIFTGLNAMMNSRFVNSISNSLSNISAHYDISNKMFGAFLSRDMTYSCAIWGEEEGGLAGDRRTDRKGRNDVLESAQLRKIRTIISRARISPGDRVLEIGTGWGSFAITAVQDCGCLVDSLTLSIEQKELAEQRIEEAGLSDSIKVHLLDYRNIPEDWQGRFDRVVSIEMIEAVGLEYLDQYFGIVSKALKHDRGLGVFQVITMPDGRFERYRKEVDFIQKHIFPGGILPSLTCLINAVHLSTKGALVLESIENIGPHYARTLREWRSRFSFRFEIDIVPALMEAYPEIRGRAEIEVFRRKWLYYFSYCASGFEMRALGTHIFTLTREANLSIVD